MVEISRDNPAYYLTSVAHNRLPIFQKDEIRQVVPMHLTKLESQREF
jgi:hypothetical protein